MSFQSILMVHWEKSRVFGCFSNQNQTFVSILLAHFNTILILLPQFPIVFQSCGGFPASALRCSLAPEGAVREGHGLPGCAAVPVPSAPAIISARSRSSISIASFRTSPCPPILPYLLYACQYLVLFPYFFDPYGGASCFHAHIVLSIFYPLSSISSPFGEW